MTIRKREEIDEAMILGVYVPEYKSEEDAICKVIKHLVPLGISLESAIDIGKGVYQLAEDLRESFPEDMIYSSLEDMVDASEAYLTKED